MNLAAVMLVKDEADIVEHTIRHLIEEGVDRVYVKDNLSTDGTTDLLDELQLELGDAVRVTVDDQVGYWQSAKTTALAHEARVDGFDWVIPCDADEWWYSTFGSLRDVIGSHSEHGYDVCAAELIDHIPTGLDKPEEFNPYRRIGWRFKQTARLGKVSCRLRPDLTIEMGNHKASFELAARRRADPALTLRHFTWRSEDQYVRKLRNGYAAYAATDLDSGTGAHWRMFGPPDEPTWEERVRVHYQTWFFVPDPEADALLVFDPVRL